MPHEEIRKIIRVGNSLAVTIPHAWAQYFKLTEDSYVQVISNGNIVIKIKKTEEQEVRP